MAQLSTAGRRWSRRHCRRRTTIEIDHDSTAVAGDVASPYDPDDHTTVLPACATGASAAQRAAPRKNSSCVDPTCRWCGSHWAQCMMDQVHDRVMATVPQHV